MAKNARNRGGFNYSKIDPFTHYVDTLFRRTQFVPFKNRPKTDPDRAEITIHLLVGSCTLASIRGQIHIRAAETRAVPPTGCSAHSVLLSSATLLLAADVNPKVIQERLEHSQIGNPLDTYSHVLPTMQREAAGKLDSILTTVTASANKAAAAASA